MAKKTEEKVRWTEFNFRWDLFESKVDDLAPNEY